MQACMDEENMNFTATLAAWTAHRMHDSMLNCMIQESSLFLFESIRWICLLLPGVREMIGRFSK